MTETQWREELAVALDGTDWVVEWSGVMQKFPTCLADVHNRVTKESKQINLSRDVFRTPDGRKAETLRQLT